MKLFSDYLRSKIKYILLFLLFTVIFAVTFFLYSIPLSAVIYPALLCLISGAVFTAVGFIRFRKKHGTLKNIKQLTSAMITELPECSSEIESDYQQIIRTLQEENSRRENAASEKYRSMTEYYSIWAHQIKTPISSMKLSLQNEDTAVSRKLSSDLLRIEQYAEMVLAFIRLDSDSTDYLFREYSIDSLLKQSLRKSAPDFISKKIRLDYEPTELKIVTDEKWFSFVIEQILSNALKYTREGSIRIFTADKNTLCISDTGIGIEADDLPRIFENGYTGFNGRLDKSASGIGLYLCKRICTNLGIGISAESEINKGTTINLYLGQRKNLPND